MAMIDLLNAAKDKVDAEDMDRAMANEDTNKKLRELIVAANEEMRTKLTDKTTLSGLGDLAAELGAGEDLIAAASAGKDKKDKKMKRLQDVIIVQWEINRVNTTHAGSERDGAEVDMQDDDDEDQEEDEVNQDSPTEEKVTEQENALEELDTGALMDKAIELGIDEAAVNAAMELELDEARRIVLIDLIMNPGGDSEHLLSAAQREALGKLTAVAMGKIRKHLQISDAAWAKAAADKHCKKEMLQLVTDTLTNGSLDQAQVDAALRLTGIGGDNNEAPKQDDDTAKQVAEALMAAAKKELEKACGAGGNKGGHIASAKVIKVVMESGGGLPASTSSGAAKVKFDKNKFKKALDAADRMTWQQMLADNPDMLQEVLKQAQGNSKTIDELVRAAQANTTQGRSLVLVSWVDREVDEPPAEWDGVRPRVKSSKLPKQFRNIKLPMQFDKGPSYSLSDLYDDIDDTSTASRFDSEKAKELKTEEAFAKLRMNHVFKTTADFREAVDRLERYLSHTQPPLMPRMSEEIELHLSCACSRATPTTLEATLAAAAEHQNNPPTTPFVLIVIVFEYKR